MVRCRVEGESGTDGGGLTVFPGDEIEAVAQQQVDDAGLHCRPRENLALQRSIRSGARRSGSSGREYRSC